MKSACIFLLVLMSWVQMSAAARSARPAAWSGPVIDVHAHVFFDEKTARSVNPDRPATPAGFLKDVADRRLRKAVAVVIAPRGIEETRAQNDRLREFTEGNNGLLLAAGSVHPGDGAEALKEIERLAEQGFSMLKLHPNTQGFSVASDEVRKAVCKAGEAGLPVLFDFSGALQSADVGEYVELAIRCPQTQLVLAHMGMARFQEMLVLVVLGEYPWYKRNIWVDISYTASLYADSPYEEQFVWVLRKIGIDRVLFGSDYPLRTTSEAIADVERLGLTKKEMQQVFAGNAMKLLKLTAGDIGTAP